MGQVQSSGCSAGPVVCRDQQVRVSGSARWGCNTTAAGGDRGWACECSRTRYGDKTKVWPLTSLGSRPDFQVYCSGREARAARAMRGTMSLDAASAIGHSSASRDPRSRLQVRPPALEEGV